MGQTVAVQASEGRAARALRDAFAPLGMVPAPARDLGAIHDLSDELIGRGLAGEDVMRAIHRRQRCGFYVAREGGRLVAATAFVLLNAEGFKAVCAGVFDPNQPDIAHVVRAGEAPSAVYGWGVGAATRQGAAAVVACCRASLIAIPRPFFARAATEAGRRLVTQRLGFVPYPGSATGLFWRDAAEPARRAA